MRETSIHKLLFGVIIVLTLSKLLLVGDGFLAFPDEQRYMASGHVLESLSNFNITEAAANLNKTQGRPGETLIKTIPSALQFISAELFGLETYERQNSYLLFLFNFIVYCFILKYIYKIARITILTKTTALLSVIIYCCLVNSYIYLRHTLPYDSSLLILLFALFNIIKTSQSNTFTYKKSFLLGLTAFFGYVVYPGYVLLFGVLFLMFTINNYKKENIKNRLQHSFVYVLGCIMCLAIFEGIARIGNTSYIQDSITLSKTITQGSFGEGYTFLFKYLYNVEQIGGILITLGLIAYTFITIYSIINKKQLTNLNYLFIITCILFLFYASLGYFFHKMVWYGRLLHQFFFLLPILAAYSITYLSKNPKYKIIVTYTLAVVFITSFLINFISYKTQYAYPRDTAWRLVEKDNNIEIKGHCEYKNAIRNMLDYMQEKHSAEKVNRTYTITNTCYYYPVDDINYYEEFIPEKGMKLIYSNLYFHDYIGYIYEGCDILERETYKKTDLKVKVYKNKSIDSFLIE